MTDRGLLTQPTQAPWQESRCNVSGPLRLSYPLGVVSRAGLGQAVALTDSRGVAQTLLTQAAVALGQWTWVWDDSVFHKYGEQLGLVGRWWSGQQKRVLSGIDGLLLLVVIGDGRLVVPVDFAIRRPDPVGPGVSCRDKLRWARVMLDERLAVFERRGLALPAPMVVADRWFSDSKLMQHVGDTHQGTLLVEGKQSYI